MWLSMLNHNLFILFCMVKQQIINVCQCQFTVWWKPNWPLDFDLSHSLLTCSCTWMVVLWKLVYWLSLSIIIDYLCIEIFFYFNVCLISDNKNQMRFYVQYGKCLLIVNFMTKTLYLSFSVCTHIFSTIKSISVASRCKFLPVSPLTPKVALCWTSYQRPELCRKHS